MYIVSANVHVQCRETIYDYLRREDKSNVPYCIEAVFICNQCDPIKQLGLFTAGTIYKNLQISQIGTLIKDDPKDVCCMFNQYLVNVTRGIGVHVPYY